MGDSGGVPTGLRFARSQGAGVSTLGMQATPADPRPLLWLLRSASASPRHQDDCTGRWAEKQAKETGE